MPWRALAVINQPGRCAIKRWSEVGKPPTDIGPATDIYPFPTVSFQPFPSVAPDLEAGYEMALDHPKVSPARSIPIPNATSHRRVTDAPPQPAVPPSATAMRRGC
ncbi:hypothetical protein CKAH01_17321 [Colletotrichum kahawae]|uniref:Uncharacterized protein n=1 Tax=Colletotrichum kahawae TaxID=34407 RepID=A0AAD9YB01_COLKA|nr:hypothetical protein CKAH01_17321 [Colletotrichum kahawae]